MYSISKQFNFEAAHRLVAPYVGKCNSLHGHSFTVTLTMSAPELNACNMVEDFSSLKPVGEWIEFAIKRSRQTLKLARFNRHVCNCDAFGIFYLDDFRS